MALEGVAMKTRSVRITCLAAALAASLTLFGAHAATPQDLLAGYVAQSGTPAAAARGEKFFAQTHGREWSCSSCHGARAHRPASTPPPASRSTRWRRRATPQRFTDPAKTEKWFRRNCNDVLGRECSAGEKADVLAWLSTLKP
jgi:cytochrome c5